MIAAPVCPAHGATMRLRSSRFGPFYSCPVWPECDVTIGVHPDGTPLGIPGDRETRRARIRAHAAFDAWWKRRGFYRDRAYVILRRTLDLSEDECHIGRFDVATCERVVALCESDRG